jgi:hypothetical protein
MSRLVLCRTPAGALVSTLSADRDLAAWHKVLTAELARLGPVHAALLAAPETGSAGLEWIAVGDRAVAASSLPGNGQQALMAALGSILADIDMYVASGQAPLLAGAWPALRRLQDIGYVYAVDGRPVLAAWGHAPAAAAELPDPLAAIMPRREPVLPLAEPVRGRPPYGLIGAFLAAALLFGLLLPGLALRPFTCATPAVAAMSQSNAAIAQNAQLTTQLAQLNEQAAQDQAQCNAPKPALPQNAWNSGNLGMLSGCWKLVTNITLRDESTGAPLPIANWRICFDQKGNGTQTVTYQSGDVCTGPVLASFNSGHQMAIQEPSECSGPTSVALGHWLCKRVSDSQANCIRTDNYGQSQGIFQR